MLEKYVHSLSRFNLSSDVTGQSSFMEVWYHGSMYEKTLHNLRNHIF